MALHRCFSPGIIVGGEAFTPLSIASLVHWWDAELSPKTGSPGNISQIDDLAGSLHLVQATGSGQPDDNTRTLNGRTAFDLDGDDRVASTTPPSFTTNFHIFTVIKIDALVEFDRFFDSGPSHDQDTDDGACCLLPNTTGNSGAVALRVSNGAGADTVATGTGAVGTTLTHLVECYSIGTTKMGIRIDGGTPVENTSMSFGCNGPDNITLWARRPSSSLNAIDGAWGMTLIFNAEVTGNDYDNLLTYIRNRWGTP